MLNELQGIRQSYINENEGMKVTKVMEEMNPSQQEMWRVLQE